MSSNMLKIGITGGIGTGKSTVASIFSSFNIPILNADVLAKQLIGSDKSLQARLIEAFGEQAFLPDGQYNTRFIAQIVFNDEKRLYNLNHIVHPFVKEYTSNWWHTQAQDNQPYAIKEAAILFESDMHLDLDFVIGVDAPEDLRIQRVILRDNIDKSQVLDRIAHQMPQNEKMKKCDFIIMNDDIQSIILQVISIHDKLLQINSL